MRRPLTGVRDESGAMLVIALIIITTVAVVTGAILSHGWTNFRATATLEGVAGTSYAADAGAKIAINDLRLGAQAPGWVTPTFPGLWTDWVYTNNADGTGCFGAEGTSPDNSVELKNLYPKAGDQAADTSVRVECSPVPGTGIFGAGSGVGIDDPDPTDAFARALTTVGTSTELWNGMTLKPLGTGNTAPMPVRGGIASRSYITVDNGALVTDGYVKAEGPCTGQIVSSPPAVCNSAGSVPVPAIPTSPLTSVPEFRKASDYKSPNCVFQPGFYNNAKALSDAVNSCTTVAKFASGKYYFDFRDEERGTGENAFNIMTTLVGGEYVAGTIPGSCKSPIYNDPIPGVQFVFGGTSRLTLSDTAHVELCGPSNNGDAPMTLYQEQTGDTLPAQPLGPEPARSVGPPANPGTKVDPFALKGGAADATDALTGADAKYLYWTATSPSREAALNLSDFDGMSGIPAGSDITSAEVRIKYAKSNVASSLTMGVKDTTLPAVTVPPSDSTTGWSPPVSLKDHFQSLIDSATFSATRPTLQLRLTGTTKDETLTVDAVELQVTYVPPSLRASQPDQFIYAPGGNFHGVFVVQGATYAPTGYVNLDPGSFDTALVAFRWGLVASGVDLKSQPSQQYGYPLVSIPDAGHGLGNKVTVVDLKVYVCREQASCASGGTHALTVRAMITDPPYTAWGNGPARPEPGRRKVEVISWAEQS